MPDDRRLLRLQQLVLETVAQSVQRDLDDPRIRMVTITRVKLARDLTSGIVFWSTLEGGAVRRTVERGLADAVPVLQGAVARALSTRLTPRLTLRFDSGLERAAKLDTLFADLARERGELPAPAPPEEGAEAPASSADADPEEPDAGEEPEEPDEDDPVEPDEPDEA